MYAKLVFPPNTSAGSRNRDIARIIHESSSGTASLDNLEFVNKLACEFYPGVNSGWTLADSGTINTGAITSADGRYIFEGSCVDSSKKKYLAVSVHGLYTNSTVLDSPYPGTVIQPIIDKGLATQNFIYGSDITTVTSLDKSSVGYSYNSSGEVYIFATPRKLILIGTQGNTSVDVELYILMHMEYEENGMSQYFNIVPQTLIAYSLGGLSSGFVPSSTTQGSYYGASAYDNTTLDMVCFPKSIAISGATARVLTLTNNAGNGYDLLHSAIDWSGNAYVFTENGTAVGVYSTLNNLRDEMLGNARQFYNSYKKWNYGPYASNDFLGKNLGTKKSLTGEWRFPLYPIYCKFDQLNTGLISYAHTNVYHGPNIGLTSGSDIRVNNDNYKYFCSSNKNSYSASLIIKRE